MKRAVGAEAEQQQGTEHSRGRHRTARGASDGRATRGRASRNIARRAGAMPSRCRRRRRRRPARPTSPDGQRGFARAGSPGAGGQRPPDWEGRTPAGRDDRGRPVSSDRQVTRLRHPQLPPGEGDPEQRAHPVDRVARVHVPPATHTSPPGRTRHPFLARRSRCCCSGWWGRLLADRGCVARVTRTVDSCREAALGVVAPASRVGGHGPRFSAGRGPGSDATRVGGG